MYFKSKFEFDEVTDSFIGITSKYLPIYKEFIQFWNTTITDEVENELEIDEISFLFKIWSKSKNGLTEENIIKILKYFFNIEIIEDKYVLNITCNIWNKLNDIKNSIIYIKQQLKETETHIISFDDLYNYYLKYCGNNLLKCIVSKRYFEKYLYKTFESHIVCDKIIKITAFE
jgi:hypothetical protein